MSHGTVSAGPLAPVPSPNALSREPKLLPLFNLFFKKEDPVRLAFCAISKMSAPGDAKCSLARV